MDLATKKCVPCEGGVKPFDHSQTEEYLKEVSGWNLSDDSKKISKEFKFESFKESINFVNKVADLAENEGHHPNIKIHYKKVLLTLTTHAIGGLSENDFILATKINNIHSYV